MPRDEYFTMPYGCMECSSIVPTISEYEGCPRCGSTEIFPVDNILQKLIEYEMFMQEVGLDRMSEYD